MGNTTTSSPQGDAGLSVFLLRLQGWLERAANTIMWPLTLQPCVLIEMQAYDKCKGLIFLKTKHQIDFNISLGLRREYKPKNNSYIRIMSYLKYYIDFDTYFFLSIQFWHIHEFILYSYYFLYNIYFLSYFNYFFRIVFNIFQV